MTSNSIIFRIIIVEILHLYLFTVSNAFTIRAPALKRDSDEMPKQMNVQNKATKESKYPTEDSYRVIGLDQIVQMHDVDTGLFVTIREGSNKIVLSDQSQSIRSLFEMTPASGVDESYPSDAWIIRSMYRTNRYICQNKKGSVYLSKLKRGCLMHKVVNQKGVTFYNYKRWTKLVVSRIEPNQFIPESATTSGQMDILSAPLPLKAMVTDLAFELYTTDLKLSTLLKQRLDQSPDLELTLAKTLDPIKGTALKSTRVTLTKQDWIKASLFDSSDVDWKAMVTRELKFIKAREPLGHFQEFQ